MSKIPLNDEAKFWINKMNWYVANREKIQKKVATMIDDYYRRYDEQFSKYITPLELTILKAAGNFSMNYENKKLTIRRNQSDDPSIHYEYDGIIVSPHSLIIDDFYLNHSHEDQHILVKNRSHFLRYSHDRIYVTTNEENTEVCYNNNIIHIYHYGLHCENGPSEIEIEDGEIVRQRFMYHGVDITKWLDKKGYSMPLSDIQKYECMMVHDFSQG